MLDTTIATNNLDALMAWEDAAAADAALIATMQNRGTRDAFIARLARATVADRKAALANIWDFTTRNEPTVMVTLDAMNNLVATTAILHWVEGDDAQALFMLSTIPDGHRMSDLLKQLVVSGIPGEKWLVGMAKISEAECLAFQG